MRRLWLLTLLLPVVLSGCAEYAQIEQVRMGMTIEDFRLLSTPTYFRGETENTLEYGCQLDVPSGQGLSKRSIRPYIMTFEDGKLSKIEYDEEESNRESLRNEYRFGYGFGTRYYYLNRSHLYHP